MNKLNIISTDEVSLSSKTMTCSILDDPRKMIDEKLEESLYIKIDYTEQVVVAIISCSFTYTFLPIKYMILFIKHLICCES